MLRTPQKSHKTNPEGSLLFSTHNAIPNKEGGGEGGPSRVKVLQSDGM